MSKFIHTGDSLSSARFVCAEMMYRPRPSDSRARAVFDFALRSRWSQLDQQDVVLLIADSDTTLDSFTPLVREFPQVRVVGRVINPAYRDEMPDTSDPARFGWESPDQWRRLTMTDRWARILAAFDMVSSIDMPGWLVMPAHDAVWGDGLLDRLARISLDHSRAGMPAAVSPYTYWQHSTCPNVDIPANIVDLLNTALSRDVWMWRRLQRGDIQAFWGKMGIIPFAMCAALRAAVDVHIWEDDLEIDRVIHKLGFSARGVWVFDPYHYRQLLPVFDLESVKRVITRLLHYSLPSFNMRSGTGGSQLIQPLDRWGKLRRAISPRYARFYPQAQALIDECWSEITARLNAHGASWVDWGAYRYVTRPGDPEVHVWVRVS